MPTLDVATYTGPLASILTRVTNAAHNTHGNSESYRDGGHVEILLTGRVGRSEYSGYQHEGDQYLDHEAL